MWEDIYICIYLITDSIPHQNRWQYHFEYKTLEHLGIWVSSGEFLEQIHHAYQRITAYEKTSSHSKKKWIPPINIIHTSTASFLHRLHLCGGMKHTEGYETGEVEAWPNPNACSGACNHDTQLR